MDEFTVVDTRTRAEWEAWQVGDREGWKTDNLAITDEGITLEKEFTATYVAPVTVERGELGEPLDVDVDCRGTLYALGADGALHRAVGTGVPFKRLACDGLGFDPGARPTACCVTDETVYVVGQIDPAGEPTASADIDGVDSESKDRGRRRAYVQGLSVRLRQTRWVVESADSLRFSDPIRVVRGPKGGCYVLDRGSEVGAGFVARMNAAGTATVVVEGLQRPRDLTVDDEGTLTVLDVDRPTDTREGDEEGRPVLIGRAVVTREGSANVERVDAGTTTVSPRQLPASAACIEAVEPGEFIIGVVPDAGGEQTLYRYTWRERRVEPLSSFKRSCRALRRGCGDDPGPQLYAIGDERTNGDRAWVVYVLEPTETVLRGPKGYTGSIDTWFDFGEIRATYYRIALGLGDQPPGTRVDLRYAVTDRDVAPEGPVDEDGNVEPDDCRDAKDEDGGVVRWTPVGESNPTDVLVKAKGRQYLWIRIDLVGTQYASPSVTSLKTSLTHESYLEYLPTIYVEDEEDPKFLERFLSVFEDTFGDVDHGIETLTEYLDPDSIPAPHLSWLGSWLATAEDDAWTDASKRTLVSEAPILFKQRGTRRGLARMLEIYLGGVEPTPVHWAVAPWSDGGDGEGGGVVRDGSESTGAGTFFSLVEYGDVVDGERAERATMNGEERAVCESDLADGPLAAPFSDLVCCPQEFVVVLAPTVGEEARGVVERIVDQERPAHTVGRIVPLSPWGRLDGHTYLGVNSYLPPAAFVVDESYLGLNSVVDGGTEAQLGFGWEARLGEGLKLS
ncbi:phage tail protein [Halobium salinum]|uniref:Phage tail protein n=1 Tax=Halobium salinum TaxID=1364940 RepID=A0ABD5PI64_9EURY|nr:phage tail protein [Halobium salinum]